MGIYIQRLEHILMRINAHNPSDPMLKPLSDLRHKANYILLGHGQYMHMRRQGSGSVQRGY